MSCAAVGLALASLGQSALAQQTAQVAQQNAAVELEEIIVVGTRASLQSAIERKKRANTVVDSLVAEDVASFPDKNVGEALQRITGVQLSRAFGEGESVSIRGVEPDLNRVEINGVSVLGNAGTGSRGADLRDMASELIKSIDVFKGFTADMTEGGVGGTVSVQTRRPLELKKTLFSTSIAGQYLDLMDKVTPRGNVTYGDKFLDDRFGVLINATYDKVQTRGDFLRNTEWVSLADFDNSPDKTRTVAGYETYATKASCSSITNSTNRNNCLSQWNDLSPRIPRYGLWERDDKRISAMATLQYQVTDDFDVYVDVNYNKRDQFLTDYNYSIDLTSSSRINAAGAVVDANHNLVEFDTSSTVPSGTGGAKQIFGSQMRGFDYTLESKYYTAGFNWNGDNWRLNGFGTTSSSTMNSNSNSVAITATVPGIHIKLSDKGIPSFTFPSSFDPSNPETYRTGTAAIQYRPEEVETSEDAAKLDFDYDLDRWFLTTLEAGGQWRKVGSVRYAGGGYTALDGTVVPSANITQNVALGTTTNGLTWSPQRLVDFVRATGKLTPQNFYDGYGGNIGSVPSGWMAPDVSQIGDWFDTSGFNHDLLREANGYAQIPAHDISEEVSAGYLKANFEFDLFGIPVSGNAGARYVETKIEASGALTRQERDYVRDANGNIVRTDLGVATTAVTTKGVAPVSIDEKYSDILPAVNFNFTLSPDEVFLRLGYAKVMARPKPTDLVPAANCIIDVTAEGKQDDLNDTCSSGNPDLDPYRADQYDVNLAWYVNPDTLLSAAYFYKDVKSFILARTLVRNVDLFNDGTLFDVSMPINGKGAKINGIELSAQTAFTFLPSPFDGLGLNVNYTYSDAKNVGLTNSLTGGDLPFPGLSKHSYNLIAYYDKDEYNLRVAYNGRTKWLQSAAERSGNPVFRDGTGYLDAKFTYRLLGSGMSFFVEGKNLTGEAERTTSGDDVRLGELAYSGKRYYVGASYKY
ncbi:TonB-dependent receptor [Niveispirillum sp. SYP-B3756]|uniref:TonB-dependent receptor n=1 Tax=Niveispirillum sp. SYP-B3756 TaxID=2662178 RepID=UPI0015635EB7|nr:TonB-dependent receptor [Niveispirillum sp. SYP-B3756]